MNNPQDTGVKQDATQDSRREFLGKSATVAGAAVAANLTGLAPAVYANGTDLIRVGLVGCGGRGKGAARQCLKAGPNIKLVAMGDTFVDRINDAYGDLTNYRRYPFLRGKIDVAAGKKFVGLDAYERVIEQCDLVILATPPGFRPIHIRAALNANKHLFTEKPVAVDGPGIRSVLESYEIANQKGLNVVAGTQRRYQAPYLEAMRRIHHGDIGEVVAGRCYWNMGGLWHRAKTNDMTDVQWQIRNWLYFTWLSGDHICEQHIHNLDVINWALQAHPEKAVGLGGRQTRTDRKYGHIFDHHAIDFTYPNDVHVMSMCRQMIGTHGNVSEAVVGTKGRWSSGGNGRITGANAWNWGPTRRRPYTNPYEQEHIELINAIRGNRAHINALRDVAHSTLTAIMGRMATYTGQEITWQAALNSNETLMPANLTFDTRIVFPDVPMPGQEFNIKPVA